MIATRIFNDLELIAQNPLQDRKGGKFRRRRVTELLRQGEEIPTRLSEAAFRNARRRIRESAIALAIDIAADYLLADPRV